MVLPPSPPPPSSHPHPLSSGKQPALGSGQSGKTFSRSGPSGRGLGARGVTRRGPRRVLMPRATSNTTLAVSVREEVQSSITDNPLVMTSRTSLAQSPKLKRHTRARSRRESRPTRPQLPTTRQRISKHHGDKDVALGKGEDPVRDRGDGSKWNRAEEPRSGDLGRAGVVIERTRPQRRRYATGHCRRAIAMSKSSWGLQTSTEDS